MKQIIFVCILFLLGATVSKAFSQSIIVVDSDLVQSDGAATLSDAAFEKLWSGNTLVCIKAGTRYVGANPAYKSVFTDGKARKKNCVGLSSKTSKTNARLGLQVVKIDPSALPKKYLCQIYPNAPLCK